MRTGYSRPFLVTCLEKGIPDISKTSSARDYAAEIAGVYVGGGVGVHGVEAVMESAVSESRGFIFEAGAEVGVGGDVGDGHAFQEPPNV